MAIPDFQSIMLPLLKIMDDKTEHNIAGVRDTLAKKFEISDSEKKEILPSGQARFVNRIAWALAYLKRAGLIENAGPGIYRITEQGLEVLRTNPQKLTLKLFKQLNPEFLKQKKVSYKSESK